MHVGGKWVMDVLRGCPARGGYMGNNMAQIQLSIAYPTIAHDPSRSLQWQRVIGGGPAFQGDPGLLLEILEIAVGETGHLINGPLSTPEVSKSS